MLESTRVYSAGLEQQARSPTVGSSFVSITRVHREEVTIQVPHTHTHRVIRGLLDQILITPKSIEGLQNITENSCCDAVLVVRFIMVGSIVIKSSTQHASQATRIYSAGLEQQAHSPTVGSSFVSITRVHRDRGHDLSPHTHTHTHTNTNTHTHTHTPSAWLSMSKKIMTEENIVILGVEPADWVRELWSIFWFRCCFSHAQQLEKKKKRDVQQR